MGLPVLFLIQHLDIGGTEHHLFDLLRGLDRARIEPHVIHFNNEEGKVARAIAALPNVKKTFVPVSRAYAPSGALAAWRVRRYLKRHRIAALVTYHFVADFLGALGALAARGGLPVISSRRDMGFTRSARQKRAGRWLERRGAVARYVAVSDAVRQALARDEGVDPARIELIYNGVEIDTAAREQMVARRDGERARLGIGADEIVIGCVANFNPVKRHEDLVAAFARARQVSPDSRLRLLLVGAGPLADRVREAVAGAGLDELTLWVDQSDDPARELIASDIVALASESEGFSNSIIQAMALARPVVACRAGGNPEAVVSGETGLLVAPRDVESLAGALLRLARDATLRRAMGQRAAARARERFTRPTMLERTQDLIERVVESQKSKV